MPYLPWPEETPLPDSYTVLDTETTGLNPEENQMIEIACIRIQEGVVTDEFQRLICCQVPLPNVIRELTGITDEMLAEKGIPFSQALRELLAFLGDDWIVGHNAEFDITFLLAACKKVGIEAPTMKTIDTIQLSRKALGRKVANFRLETLVGYYQIADKQSHRALSDARLIAQLYDKLNEK